MKIFRLWYARKSSESDERQVQSIDSQITWMKGVLQNFFDETEVRSESKSAKDPYKRPEFQHLLDTIEKINKKQKWEYEIYIYAWGLDRLSRNPVDSGMLQYFLQIWKIHKIICVDKEFTRADSWIMMWLFNALNNQFILDLQKNTRRGMKDKADKGWCIQFTPNGYINNRLTKEAEVDEKLKPIVKEIFQLRAEKYSLRELVKYCKKKWYKTKKWTDFSKWVIEKMLKNPFYIGLQKSEWVYKKANHEVFIDVKLFKEINEQKQKWHTRKQIDLFPLKWIVKSRETKRTLVAEIKKWKYIYYRTHNSYNKEEKNVSISQNAIISYFDEIIHLYDVSTELRPIVSGILQKEFAKRYEKIEEERKSIEQHLSQARAKSKRLFDLVCKWTISDEKYKEEESMTIIEIQKYEEQLKENSDENVDIMEQNLKFVELLENISTKRKSWDNGKKIEYIKLIAVELFVNEKKELFLHENQLFEFIRMVNLDHLGCNGARRETRTLTRLSTGF